MNVSPEDINEKIIKSKKRVQNHGEVFTPSKIAKEVLNMPVILEASQSLTTRFLEPSAGEGVFLVEILNRKINVVLESCGDDLTTYENYSLLVLSTLYGVELLEDNAQKCVMNMYQVYYENYQRISSENGKKMKAKVLDSAKLIISKNIAQGDFLTKLSASGKPIVFSEWEVINLNKGTKVLKVQRTEYTLQDIIEGSEKEKGESSTYSEKIEQLDLFNCFSNEEVDKIEKKQMKYMTVKIIDIYKEEMEESNG